MRQRTCENHVEMNFFFNFCYFYIQHKQFLLEEKNIQKLFHLRRNQRLVALALRLLLAISANLRLVGILSIQIHPRLSAARS